jgi:DNA polymerase (family 10)
MIAKQNEPIADKLREMADLLEIQHEDGFRVSAYRRAARTISEMPQPLEEIVQDRGLDGLIALPGIGRGIGGAIIEMLETGRWGQLDRLTGSLEPERLLQSVPGLGPELAARIHDELHIDTLEQLEQAAHDGTLDAVPGMGPRRTAVVRAALAERLGHRHVRRSEAHTRPPVSLLLQVDEEYHDKARRGVLRKIAPKRFNPTFAAWLPVLHTRRDGWDVTVLFSNTERAHALDRTWDWVVIYFHRETEAEAQCTVVTETRGPLTGRRVVRGREGECIAHYASIDAQPEPSIPAQQTIAMGAGHRANDSDKVP